MKTWIAGFIAFCAIANLARSATPPRSVSTSRQFIVYGADAQLRGAMCDLAEQTKRAALKLLGESDAWKTPIIVNAQLPQAERPELPRARLSFSQTGFGLKLQLDLSIDAEVSGPAVERELLRAVYLEMMYRAAPETPAGTPYVEPPDWLLEGTLALGPDRSPAGVVGALRAPVESGNIVSLDQLLRQRPDLLDSPSRALYRAYSAALVAALTDSPEGARRLARFVSELPRASNDPVAEFRAHFPRFGESADQMQKEWTLTVARVAASERYRLLSSDETEQELTRIMHVELREKDHAIAAYTLEEFPQFVRVRAAAAALKQVREQLLLLSGRSNPLYRPIIAEYDKIVVELAHGKTKRLPARLAELRATREHLARRMSAIGDYMNWFEATQAHRASGAFREYMKAAELTAEREHHRHDAISVYLDAVEAQF
ncbi:MAG: hypothetical protein M3032_13475 [Verrucomicrobiota bacterium]|nr:hypothetical protein [Verrucomicrobiota bacterium]